VKDALLFLVLLTNQGYWTGGQENTISINPIVEAAPLHRDVSLTWELALDSTRLAKGSAKIDGSELRIAVPDVRVRTTLQFVYAIEAGGKAVQRGEHAIYVFPPPRPGDWTAAIKGKRVCVWGVADVAEAKPGGPKGDLNRAGESSGVIALLKDLKVEFDLVHDATKLALRSPDVLIVLPNAIPPSVLNADPLLDLARGGANVLVLEQRRARGVAGYEISPRVAPKNVVWRGRHPLLVGLDPIDVDRLLKEQPVGDRAGADARPAQKETKTVALRLPVDEPALEIISWPQEAQGDPPGPLDCLLATCSVGKGRIVFCQLPFTSFDRDPRALLLLNNALNYFQTRPESTPRPSERKLPPTAAPSTAPQQNRIPLGN
jgi:hypothetical protein